MRVERFRRFPPLLVGLSLVFSWQAAALPEHGTTLNLVADNTADAQVK
jgi:hypothetical protein